jgi:polyisoprenyl-teichoic acid--peptidoglycan teichoic acid transferase
MSMDPPPSDRPPVRRPYPVPERPVPTPEPVGAGRVHARDLIDQLPEPDPALLRDPQPEARRRRLGGRRRRRAPRSWGQRILLSVLVVTALVAGSAATVAGYLGHKLDQIAYVRVDLTPPPPPGEPRNYLIVGSDSRDSLAADPDALASDTESTLDTGAFTGDGAVGSGQRSDTIIVMRVDPGVEAVDVLSIPRDLWVTIPATGRQQRINAAYAGGPQELIDAIEENLDLPVHHYVEVDFVGFAGLVDAVGGVPMWFDTPVRDTHSGLHVDTAGCHLLDARSALAYARSRHFEYQLDSGRWATDGTGDLGRISRQHVFLRRAIDQVSDLGLTDARTLNRLLDVGINSVTLDRGLGLSQLRDLAQRFSDFDSEALRTHALPTTPFRTSGGAAVLRLGEAEAQPALNLFRGLPPGTLAPVQVDTVTVLNGTGIEGQAALVADALSQVGFGVVETGNVEEASADSPLRRTTIRHHPGALHQADLLERHLSAGAELVVDRSLEEGEVVLEIGTDLTTIGRNARPGELSPPDTTTTSSTVADDVGLLDPAPTEEAVPIGVAPDPSVRCS